ncbi:hypothetical protein BJ508DRAFT_132848 [Ascobolus immersus RN42]|uniref:Uncharacterized protein n=1 Tax=Ascobolus immersus RN42 TaxID=1160509 RepID=A0A3N4I1I2_ASCIM|nr:hypothetical protein BJ508DRAFT_132848 [Ascobolus immersus RN42]
MNSISVRTYPIAYPILTSPQSPTPKPSMPTSIDTGSPSISVIRLLHDYVAHKSTFHNTYASTPAQSHFTFTYRVPQTTLYPFHLRILHEETYGSTTKLTLRTPTLRITLYETLTSSNRLTITSIQSPSNTTIPPPPPRIIRSRPPRSLELNPLFPGTPDSPLILTNRLHSAPDPNLPQGYRHLSLEFARQRFGLTVSSHYIAAWWEAYLSWEEGRVEYEQMPMRDDVVFWLLEGLMFAVVCCFEGVGRVDYVMPGCVDGHEMGGGEGEMKRVRISKVGICAGVAEGLVWLSRLRAGGMGAEEKLDGSLE